MAKKPLIIRMQKTEGDIHYRISQASRYRTRDKYQKAYDKAANEGKAKFFEENPYNRNSPPREVILVREPEFNATLQYQTFRRGNSGAWFVYSSIEGDKIKGSISVSEFDKLVKEIKQVETIKGRWKVVRKGSSISLSYVGA